ncbi:MAG: RNA polymerase sigma factor [Oscillochloris sp.]|nr:RNA polymerase sigma factor [Oscillochloris sp.]
MRPRTVTLGDAEPPGQLVAEWFACYHNGIYRYLTRLLGDGERAADVLQETFERALVTLKHHPPPENESAWLYRVATNLAYDTLRRQRRFRWLPLRGQERAPAFEDASDEAQTVRCCLAALRPHEAESLLLYAYVGLSCVEIGILLDATPATIRVRIHRARQRFRALYDRE